MNNAHILYNNNNKNIPKTIHHIIYNNNGQVVLGMCKICRKVEAELTAEPNLVSKRSCLQIHSAATFCGRMRQ